jgi:kynurenine 3-monooxygenase
VNKGSRNRLSLGLLPMKDANMVRPANTNTPYDHEIWSLQTGSQAKVWFTQAFPRIPWGSLVDDAEWERFVQAKGITFPHCQYSPGSAVAAPDGFTGVVLVGDACE